MTNYSEKNELKSAVNKIAPWKSKVGRFYKKSILLIEISADVATMFLSFTFGANFFSYLFHSITSNPHDLYHLGVFSSLLAIFLFERFGLYKRQLSLMNIIETRKIIHSFIILFPVMLFYSSVNLSVSYKVMASCLGLTFFIIIIERMIFFKFQQYLHLIGINNKQVIIAGADDVGRTLFQSISQSPKLGYTVIGFFDENQDILNTAKDWYQIENRKNLFFESDLDKLGRMLTTMEEVDIFMALPNLSPAKMEHLTTFFTKRGAKVSYIPYMYGYFIEHIRMMEINGIPLFSTEAMAVRMPRQITKRLFDLILSIATVALISPLLLLISLLIKKYSPGSVLFKQTRIGKDGKPFEIYKFRTMYMDAPAYSTTPSSSDDPRITKIGKILRKTSLDELPQFFNVIKGEMSLVGPRPEMPFIVEKYNLLHRERLRVKPGITGVWQLSGDRTRPIHENMAYDIFYIKNCSVLLDIIILCRTFIWGIASMKTH